MSERGFHQFQAAVVARQTIVVAPGCPRQALGSEAADGQAKSGIVDVGVKNHAEDVVEQHQAFHVGLNQLRLALGHLQAGSAIGAGQPDGPMWGSVAADSVADAADCLTGEQQQGDGYSGEYDGGDAGQQDVA